MIHTARPGGPQTANGASQVSQASDRIPTLPAVAALSVGIVLDRFAELPVGMTAIVAGTAVASGLLMRRRRLVATISILIVLAAIGGLRHHLSWFIRPTSDVSLVSVADDSPVRVVGIVASPVEVRSPERTVGTPAWMLQDRSSFDLNAESFQGTEVLLVTGRLRIDVAGRVNRLTIGQRVELLGRLRIPGEPRDPGGFDLRQWLKSQGIDRAVQVEHPAAISVVGDASTAWHRLARVREACRQRCETILASGLSPDTREVGTSLLLGTRSGMTDEIREAFIHSGTMHLLAISGLHVGILAAIVFTLCRLANVPTGWMVVIVFTTLWGYALMTDLRPPVLRSALLGCLIAAAVPRARPVSGLNLLTGAALLMLLWSPVDLFDVGAQLSFLAVAAILWSSRLLVRWRQSHPRDQRNEDLTRTQRLIRSGREWATDAYVVTAAIWLFTLPLTLAWFRLFSPIGFVINVGLVPFSLPLLCSGFLTLFVGLLVPPLAFLPAALYELCLRVLLWIVRWAANSPLSFVTTPAPAVWQLVVFYSLLAAALLIPFSAARRVAWRALAVTVAGMLLWAARPGTHHDLIVTFLDVGHGGAVLFQFPGGETALFDAGSFGRGEAAERTILRALEARRVTGLNALILSHADSDHYNAAAGLIEQIPVAVVYISQAFPDPTQWSVEELCRSVVTRGLPLRMLQAGDEVKLSGNCELDVMHPAGDFRDRLDNAQSIVLRTRYAGRTVIVTGDVEKAGVRALMEAHPAERIDVFQAPHHGGKMSNTMDLARWALPRYVVACNRDDSVLPRLREVYVDADRIVTSASHGTITAAISREGEIRLTTSLAGTP